MGVDLDWEIEDRDAPPDINETTAPLEQATARRHWRVLASMGLVLAAMAVAGVWLAQEQGQRRLENELRSVVTLEAQALARGDEEIFMSLQDPADSQWRQAQRTLLQDRAGGEAASEQVEILALGLEGKWAWAEVRAERPADNIFNLGGPDDKKLVVSDQVQFYRRVGDTWKRAAPNLAFLAYWGQAASVEAAHLQFNFYERDRPQVDAWLAALTPYVQEVCLDLGCPAGLMLTVELSPTLTLAEAMTVLDPESPTVALPSPHAIGVRQDDPTGRGGPLMLLALSFSVKAVSRTAGGQAAFDRDVRAASALLARAALYREFDRAVMTLGTADFRQQWAGFKNLLLAPLAKNEWVPLEDLASAPSWQLPEGQAWTLIEYVAQTYGRQYIGELLRTAQEHALMVDVLRLGLPVNDLGTFESGWRRFAAANYGQAMRDFPIQP